MSKWRKRANKANDLAKGLVLAETVAIPLAAADTVHKAATGKGVKGHGNLLSQEVEGFGDFFNYRMDDPSRTERRASKPHFGVPSDLDDDIVRDNLCSLCGEELASESRVVVIVFWNDLPLDADMAHFFDERGRPTWIGSWNTLRGGVLHPRCAKVTITHCPHIRRAFTSGYSSATGRPLQTWVASVDKETWFSSPRDHEGHVDMLFDFRYEDELMAEAADRPDPIHDESVTTFDGSFPKGMPRPLYQGMPVPFNTSLVEAS